MNTTDQIFMDMIFRLRILSMKMDIAKLKRDILTHSLSPRINT